MRIIYFSALAISMILLLSVVITPGMAEQANPNALGISTLQVHLLVRDIDSNRKFFVSIGGTSIHNAPQMLEMIRFPGAIVVLQKGQPSAGSVGSVLDHVGLAVKNMEDAVAQWEKAGIVIEPGIRPTQKWLTSPDGVRLEMNEDATLTTPIAWHHLHYFSPESAEMRVWYEKNFGAESDRPAQLDTSGRMFEVDRLPGTRLNLTKIQSTPAPTRGRAIDHIGFEVKNLREFCRRLEKAGAKFDKPYQTGSDFASALLTDPWGTSIELTDGFVGFIQ